MPNEIERKFLVDLSQIKDLLKEPSALTQTYLTSSEKNTEIRVRKIVKSGSSSPEYVRTTKKTVSNDGLVREEIEEHINQTEYDEALTLSDPTMRPIKKLRYKIDIEFYKFELDIYLDNLKGLATGEIEFHSEEEARAFDYKKYDFIIDDITKDKRYKNAYLAKNGMPVDKSPKRNCGMTKE